MKPQLSSALRNLERASRSSALIAPPTHEQLLDTYLQSVRVTDPFSVDDLVEATIAIDAGDEILDLQLEILDGEPGQAVYVNGSDPGAGRNQLGLGDIAVVDGSDFTSGELLRWNGTTWEGVASTALTTGYLLADGTVQVTGTLRPDVTQVHDLGLTARRWNQVWTDGVQVLGGVYATGDGVAQIGTDEARFDTLYALRVSAVDMPLELRGAIIDVGGAQIADVADPVNFTDAANAQWVIASFVSTLALRTNPWFQPVALAQWGLIGMTGWSGVSSGTGAAYIAGPQFFAGLQSTQMLCAATCETGNGTVGTNARAQWQANAAIWLANGTRILVQVMVESTLGQAQAIRVGLVGDAVTPASTGRPATGAWLEFDRAIDAVNWGFCVGTASSYTRVPTTLPVTVGVATHFEIRFVSTSSVQLYVCSSAAAPVLAASVGTNVPSTATNRTCRVFWQVEKVTVGVSTSRCHVFIGDLMQLRTTLALLL